MAPSRLDGCPKQTEVVIVGESEELCTLSIQKTNCQDIQEMALRL